MKKHPQLEEEEVINDGIYYPVEDEEEFVPSCTPLPNEEELSQPFIVDQLFEYDAPQHFDFDEIDNTTFQQRYFNTSLNPLTGNVTTTPRLLNDVDWFLYEHPELEPIDDDYPSFDARESFESPRTEGRAESAYHTPPHVMSPLVFKTPQRRLVATPLSPSLAKLGKAVRVVSASPLAPITPSGLASPLRRPLAPSVMPSPLRVTIAPSPRPVSVVSAPSVNSVSAQSVNSVPAFNSVSAPSVNSVSAPSVNSVSAPSVNSVSAPSVNSVPAPSVNSVPAPSVNSVSAPSVAPSPKPAVISAQPRRVVRTNQSVSPTTAETVRVKGAKRVTTSAARVAQENTANPRVNHVRAVNKVTLRTGPNDVLQDVTRMLHAHNKKIREQHRDQVRERAKKPSVAQVKQFATSRKSSSPQL